MYTFRPTLIQQLLYPSIQWRKSTNEKLLYLTFDDGPYPNVTEWVLETLSQYQARATFFVVGQQVEKHPELLAEIMDKGHRIGNHSYSHLNGWKTDLKKYLSDIDKCHFVLQKHGCETDLFRPPYGRIKLKQARQVKQKLMMWSLLSGDFDPNLNIEKAFDKLMKARKGDVLLFHDSNKAEGNLKHMLPVVLDYYSQLGYRFETL